MRTDGQTVMRELMFTISILRTHVNSVQRKYLNWGRDTRLLHFHVLRNAAGTRGLNPKCVLPFYTVTQCLEHLSVFDVPVQTSLASFHP